MALRSQLVNLDPHCIPLMAWLARAKRPWITNTRMNQLPPYYVPVEEETYRTRRHPKSQLYLGSKNTTCSLVTTFLIRAHTTIWCLCQTTGILPLSVMFGSKTRPLLIRSSTCRIGVSRFRGLGFCKSGRWDGVSLRGVNFSGVDFYQRRVTRSHCRTYDFTS